MPKLPSVSGKEAIRAFERLGYEQVRQKGSHVIMDCEGCRPIAVPAHREIKRGTLRGLIKDAGSTVEEFLEVL